MIFSNRKSKIANRKSIWGGARVVEWGRLLSGYRGEILGRRFESCPPRHRKRVPAEGEVRVLIRSHAPIQGMIFESCPPRQIQNALKYWACFV